MSDEQDPQRFPEACRQHGCKLTAAFRYTWPGRDESFVCVRHAGQLSGVAAALGMYLQLVPLTPEEFRRIQGLELQS